MPTLRSLARFAAIVVLASVATLTFFAGEFRWQPRVISYNLLAAAIFSACIGGPLQWLLPRVALTLNRRLNQPAYWGAMIGVMMAK